MKIILEEKFTEKLKNLRESNVKNKIYRFLEQVESCDSLQDIKSVVKLTSRDIYVFKINLYYRLLFSSFQDYVIVLDLYDHRKD